MNREAGHTAESILLEASVLGLAAVPIGGFNAATVRDVRSLPSDEEVPVGYPAR